MRSKQHLNGCDYLMLGFDRELRREGFAGNACQIVLELPRPVCPVALQSRLEDVSGHYSILEARPGGVVWPQWRLPRRTAARQSFVRFHPFEQGDGMRGQAVSATVLTQRLFNEPLAIRRGELIRF